MSYRCPRCQNDPQPPNYGSPRRCAFTEKELRLIEFTPDNWNCGTLSALVASADPDSKHTQYGDDESLDLILCDPDAERGWIVLTRYKSRGTCSSAVHVGDFWPARIVTLDLVEKTIAYHTAPRLRTVKW
jgi:hypothetical protein